MSYISSYYFKQAITFQYEALMYQFQYTQFDIRVLIDRYIAIYDRIYQVHLLFYKLKLICNIRVLIYCKYLK